MKNILMLRERIKIILIFWFVGAMYLQYNVGLADNGDFTRAMKWISSGPVGIEPNWPQKGTEAWSRRFFNYWIPYWKLEWNMSKLPPSSVILLWLPGALLNYFLYSTKILYLPILSLFPRFIIFIFVLLLFKWIESQYKYRLLFLLGLGVPITLITTSTDYVVYFNSFYQETASFVFLFLFLASILILKKHHSIYSLIFSITSLLLLVTSKASNVYWSIIGIPFVFYIWSMNRQINLHTKLGVGLALTLGLTLVWLLVTVRGSVRDNAYNSLFFGVITFSDNPSKHLRLLGFDQEASRYIDTSSYSALGRECLAKYESQITHLSTFKVIWNEPAILFKSLKYALDRMQKVKLDYLGRYAFDDPRNAERGWEVSALNLWGLFKSRFFPVGYGLGVTLVIFLLWFIVNLKQDGFYRDLAIVGLICTIACGADIMVAILGDGKYELVKHLFLSNLLFDIAAIAFLNSIVVFCLDIFKIKFLISERNNINLF